MSPNFLENIKKMKKCFTVSQGAAHLSCRGGHFLQMCHFLNGRGRPRAFSPSSSLLSTDPKLDFFFSLKNHLVHRRADVAHSTCQRDLFQRWQTPKDGSLTSPPDQIASIPQDLAMSFLPWETFCHPPPFGDSSTLRVRFEPLPLQLMGSQLKKKNQTVPFCLYYLTFQASRHFCLISLARGCDFLEDLSPFHDCTSRSLSHRLSAGFANNSSDD